jgi:hypothetical protein
VPEGDTGRIFKNIYTSNIRITYLLIMIGALLMVQRGIKMVSDLNGIIKRQ